jgi:hypothetical protein
MQLHHMLSANASVGEADSAVIRMALSLGNIAVSSSAEPVRRAM